jgi:hypothetical protein
VKERVRTRRVGELLARLGGAREDAIGTAEGDRQYFVGFACILLFTAGIAGISMAFALLTIHAPWYVAVPLALVWASGILAIDRILALTLTRRAIVPIITRVLLAAVLGAVISTPVTLEVFRPEIEAELVTMRNEAAKDFQQQLENDPRLVTEEQLRVEVKRQSKLISNATNVNPRDDQRYRKAQRVANKARQREAREAAQLVAGDPGGVYATALALREAAEAREARLRAAAIERLSDQNGVVVETAQAALDDAQRELDSIEADRIARQAAFDATQDAVGGIDSRLEASGRIAGSRPWGWVPHVLVGALFFLIELLPITVKLLRLSARPRSVHDEVATLRDDVAIELAQHRAVREIEGGKADIDAAFSGRSSRGGGRTALPDDSDRPV